MKWIALLLMVLDHIGYYFDFLLPDTAVLILRLVGRLSFPVFAYSCALGFVRTTNRARYFVRMAAAAATTQLLMAAVSHYTGLPSFVNVLFTFAAAIAFLSCWERFERIVCRSARSRSADLPDQAESDKTVEKVRKSEKIFNAIPYAAGMAALLVLSVAFRTDYSAFGILSVFLFYLVQKKWRIPGKTLRDDPRALAVMSASFLALNLTWAICRYLFFDQTLYWSLAELFSVCCIPVLMLDIPRRRPAPWEKYLFYIFYPAHLALFMFVKYALLLTR